MPSYHQALQTDDPNNRHSQGARGLHPAPPYTPSLPPQPPGLIGMRGGNLLVNPCSEEMANVFKDIEITGVDKAGVTRPRNDGTSGSGLYKVPFKLSDRPPDRWDELFVEAWNHPASYTTMHRPGIARVSGDSIILDGTTMEEVEKYHKPVLEAAVERANAQYREYDQQRAQRAAEEKERAEQHRREVDEAADRMKFGKE
jgi:hypothetical protein